MTPYFAQGIPKIILGPIRQVNSSLFKKSIGHLAPHAIVWQALCYSTYRPTSNHIMVWLLGFDTGDDMKIAM